MTVSHLLATIQYTAVVSTTDARATRFYRPELDILRFFAFLAVFIHHSLPVSIGLPSWPIVFSQWLNAIAAAGRHGVDLFFVLSSYLITELLIREYGKYQHIDVKSFYIRRTLRIWPLYFFFLLLSIVLDPYLFPLKSPGLAYTLLHFIFLGNWAIILYGLPSSIGSILWSVSIEEQFYVIWPLLIRRFGIASISVISAIFIVIAWVARILIVTLDIPGVFVIWCNTFARLDPIAAGALLAVFLRGAAPKIHPKQRVGLFLAGLMLFLFIGRYLSTTGMTSLLTFPLATLGSVILTIAVLVDTPAARFGILASSVIKLGRISYGLYVFHYLALTIGYRAIPETLSYPTRLVLHIAIGLPLTIIMALASYRWLEQPFLRLKEHFAHIQSQPTALSTLEDDYANDPVSQRQLIQ